MAIPSSLRIESVSRGIVSYVRLYGTVDETFDPNDLLNAVDGRDVIINLKAVTRYSSFGVREWVHTMDALTQKVDRVLFVDCSPAVVSQLNMVSNFSGGADVVSVQVPYYCESCSWDTEIACNLAQDERKKILAEPVLCKRCGTQMILDDEEEVYFAFQRGKQPTKYDPQLIKFIHDFTNIIPETKKRRPGESGKVARRITGKIVNPLHLRLNALFSPFVQKWIKATNHQRWSFFIVLALIILAITVGISLFRNSGVDPHQLAQFYIDLKKGDVQNAEKILREFEQNKIPEKLLKQYRHEITNKRYELQTTYTTKISQLFKEKKYSEVIAQQSFAEKIAPLDLEVIFFIAESHRFMKQPTLGHSFYQQIIDKASFSDSFFDDALFWQADFHMSQGNTSKAKVLYDKIVNLPKSDFIRSAKKRLKKISNQAQKKKNW